MDEPVNQVQFLNTWSLVHFGFWFAVAILARWKMGPGLSLPRLLVFSLLGAYAWEVVEYAIAQVPILWPLTESAVNRWGSDPLMALVAVPLAYFAVGAAGGPRAAARHR